MCIRDRNNTIVWGTWSTRNLECASLDGSSASSTVLVNKNFSISDVELDLDNGFVYYGNGSGQDAAERGLYRAGYSGGCGALSDGLLVPDATRVYGITFDLPGSLVYWTSPDANDVSLANLDGTGVVNNFCSGGNPPGSWINGLDLLNGTLYWNAFGSDRTYSSPASACNVTTYNLSLIHI